VFTCLITYSHAYRKNQSKLTFDPEKYRNRLYIFTNVLTIFILVQNIVQVMFALLFFFIKLKNLLLEDQNGFELEKRLMDLGLLNKCRLTVIQWSKWHFFVNHIHDICHEIGNWTVSVVLWKLFLYYEKSNACKSYAAVTLIINDIW
jgi:hypothetical protein